MTEERVFESAGQSYKAAPVETGKAIMEWAPIPQAGPAADEDTKPDDDL